MLVHLKFVDYYLLVLEEKSISETEPMCKILVDMYSRISTISTRCSFMLKKLGKPFTFAFTCKNKVFNE